MSQGKGGGPKPKPAHLKALEGRPRHKIPKHEPVSPGDLPLPPAHLDAYALEEWYRVAAGLAAMGMLSSIDQATLGAYCAACGQWRLAREEMQKRMAAGGPLAGLVDVTKAGNVIQNPLVGIANKAAADMVRYAAEFGLTPSARARLGIDLDKQGKGKFAGLIGMDGGKK